ncbi:MAG: hypothetical protein HY270_05130 [Deltaproteobacteria bacterium]|nr:hypothetical protein [Deltaproteobacteria bacterium]
MSKLLLLAGLIAVMSCGCASRASLRNPMMHAEVNLSPKDVRLLSVTEGKSCVPVVFGIQLANPSYIDAHSAAKSKVGAEVLLDEYGYEGVESALGIGIPNPAGEGGKVFLVYGDHCQYVEGVGAKIVH